MVSLKIYLITTILLISEAYSQLAGCGCGNYQRCGTSCGPSCGPSCGTSCGTACGTAATPVSSVMPCGQFIVPAVIKPMIPSCQTAQPALCAPCKPSAVASCAPSACYDYDDDDTKLDKLLYLLISNMIENKKGSGKKQSGCDLGEAYGEDYECGAPCTGAYSTPAVYSSASECENGCPEISVFVRPCYDD